MEPFIVVVDNRNSALALVAKQRIKFSSSEMCYASDFKSPNSLLKYLLASEKRKILFAWRGALREALEIKSATRIYRKLLEAKTVHLLIPDLLGTNPRFVRSEARLLNITHGYWVTSFELRRIYTQLFSSRPPTGVLHDMPDVSLILTIREMKLSRNGIVWVGNSKWGSNYGYVDHKGYTEIVQPLQLMKLPFRPFKIIDSSVNPIPNSEVVREIAQSEVLIQASAHEGTGLPLLEALGVGTIPITSNVGVASEILTGELKQLIVERKANNFAHKIAEIEARTFELSNLCTSTFDTFIRQVSSESIDWLRFDIDFSEPKRNFLKAIRISMLWIYRHYRSSKNR